MEHRAKSNKRGKLNKKDSPGKILKIIEKDPWDGNFNSIDYKDHEAIAKAKKEALKKKRKSVAAESTRSKA